MFDHLPGVNRTLSCCQGVSLKLEYYIWSLPSGLRRNTADSVSTLSLPICTSSLSRSIPAHFPPRNCLCSSPGRSKGISEAASEPSSLTISSAFSRNMLSLQLCRTLGSTPLRSRSWRSWMSQCPFWSISRRVRNGTSGRWASTASSSTYRTPIQQRSCLRWLQSRDGISRKL